jgi:hypothetical protein
MKITLKLLTAAVIGLTLALGSCKKHDPTPPSVEEQQLTKLSTTWKASSVTLDGTPQTGYDGFTLTISGTAGATSFGFATSGRPTTSPWSSGGTWTFGADPQTQITRDDKVGITYSVSDTQLQLNFNFSGSGYTNTRVSKVTGDWIFNFTKQ